MDKRNNPYAPGAGINPPELAGRDQLLEDAGIAMDRILRHRPARGMLLLGLRGVGKTVLLNQLKSSAEDKRLHAVKLEAPEEGELAKRLGPALKAVLYQLQPVASAGDKARRALSVLRNFLATFKVSYGEIGITLEAAPGKAESGNLEQDLPDLLLAVAESAADRGSGLVLLVDEVQYLSGEELAALIVACHEAAQRGLPLLLVGAGLPQIAALAGNAKSYAERLFTYPPIGPLDRAAARAALEIPARGENVEYRGEALDRMVEVSHGYPYFLQEWGSEVWNVADASPIPLAAVEMATPRVMAGLDANFFKVRFDRLTPLEQKYLRAMAELGAGPYKTGEISAALGLVATRVAPTRAQLIRKGMVWSQRHGETAFTVPLFDQFMKRQMPVLETHQPRPR